MQTKVNVKILKSKTFAESEAFKKLRTNIQFSGKNIKVIAFTSTYPGEGKSGVSFRIANSLADMGKKTLYLDVDLRNSNFLNRTVTDLKGELKGFVHCLVGENTLDEVIVQTQNPNLDFIPIGAYPPNPSELLAQETYNELIEELKQKYDYVIIDTPPAGYVVDGVISASVADGVIFVVSSGNVSIKNAKQTIRELDNAGCKVMGCVLNKINTKDDSRYGYSYRGSYGSYGYGYAYGRGYTRGFDDPKASKKPFWKILTSKFNKK